MKERGPSGTKPVIALVVDDNEISRIVAEEILRGIGIDVDLAESGADAVELALKSHYDLIFMDYCMPGMDGAETARRIRGLSGWNSKTPIIGLSAGEDDTVPPEMDAHLGKPIDVARLEVALRRWLPRACGRGDAPAPESGPLRAELDAVQGCCPELDIRATLQQIGGSETAYIGILRIFSGAVAGNAEALEYYARTGDWENLRIAVHAQRGALYNIGARPLAERAHSLERLAASENYTETLSGLPSFREALVSLGERIGGVLAVAAPMREALPAATQWQRALVAGRAARVLALLVRLEREAALEELRAITALRYGGELDRLLGEARRKIEDFDYDGASALLQTAGDTVRGV